jgi:hypothetical protein
MAILNNSNAISPSGYDVNNSLRIRGSASAYLNRTPGTAGNRKTWTWSAWVKLGTISTTAQTLFAAQGQTAIYINDGTYSNLRVNGVAGGDTATTALFRDPSAWYHIVVAVDTTQATASNRLKMYVNGVQYTNYVYNTDPTLNGDSFVNSTALHTIGRRSWNSDQQFDGYIAEQYLIDGSAKAASDFGETDATTGSWKPKAYTGTYGTNGFYLKFSDIATTSGSNAGLGKDFSGNTNYWTTNNISVTAGTTYDAMTDSPTLTSATVANYAVLNPLNQNTSISLTEANLRVTSSGSPNKNVFCTMDVPKTEKIYFEVNVVTGTSTGNYFAVGIAPSTLGLSTEIGSVSGSFSIESDQALGSSKLISGTNTSYGAGTNFVAGNILQVAIDQASGKIWFGKNNTWFDSGNPSAGTNPATSTLSTTEQYFIGTTFYIASGTPPILAFNFGQRPFSYTPPTGFVRLNTYNLPDSTIKKGNTVMDATLYTGTGTTQVLVNQAQFKPDFVWMKGRSNVRNNNLYDSVRGTTKELNSNTTGAETTNATGLTAFNSNGWTIGSDGGINTSSETYVGWQWQAGQGTNTSNTSGSITSTVSVNATAGFSIVTYTGNGTGGATIGHGLGVAPAMVIAKQRSSSGVDWIIYNKNLPSASYTLSLNSTAAQDSTNFTTWNGTAPSSTLITLGTSVRANGSGVTYVAYCWAEIAGFSKLGSYTGNGSADGPFVFTGFRPKFIIIKCTSNADSWYMLDTSRSTYNATNQRLFANASSAESSGDAMDILSNGFKNRSSTTLNNLNGGTYIYMAFAENPFKNSNAR